MISGMTFAEFLAAAFWPTVVLFAVLLTRTRDFFLRRAFLTAALVAGFLYFGLWALYGQSSMAAIWDFYLFGALCGVLAVGVAAVKLFKQFDAKTSLMACGGLVMAAFFLGVLHLDFFGAPTVLEGRVQNPRYQSRAYVVDIAGQTVKVTTPLYKRLLFKPYVRVEVGRGSNYILSIEHLAN